MSVILKATIGTVNYLNFLHVTASKVESPTSIVWETWIDVPVTNYNLVIPNLDPSNYYIRYYDAATNASLGTLISEILVNALTGETIVEKRFYTGGGIKTTDPVVGSNQIVDPYFAGKSITGVFKEGFRYLDSLDEWAFNDLLTKITVTNGTTFDLGERAIVEITYVSAQDSGPTATGGNGLYSGSVAIANAVYTMQAADINKRIRLQCAGTTQEITILPLANLPADSGFYFDNSTLGLTNCVKIKLPANDRIMFNGFDTPSNLFNEFWVAKGEHLLLRKFSDLYWEVITDYRGVSVGEKVTVGSNTHPNIKTENGQLLDGDEHPRFWWWLTNVLPATYRHTPIQDVTNPLFNWTAPDVKIRVGMFMVHPTLKKFRMPNTQFLSERGLSDFSGNNLDVGRQINYAGGVQEEMIGPHSHPFDLKTNGTSSDANFPAVTSNQSSSNGTATTKVNIATENRVKNIGVIYGRRF